MERLQKIIANAGMASRRKAEELISAGQVRVNGKIVKELGLKFDADTDKIEVDGKLLKQEKKVYYIVNKPKGVISTVADPQARKTVVNLVKSKMRLYPVGRLDTESHGLMLLTNDGELAYQLSHPKFEHIKEYIVRVHQGGDKKAGVADLIKRLQRGVKLKEGKAKVDTIEVVSQKSDQSATLRMIIHQGWNRQIRRMVEQAGWYVGDLQRIGLGNLQLGDLPLGESRAIKKTDILKTILE